MKLLLDLNYIHYFNNGYDIGCESVEINNKNLFALVGLTTNATRAFAVNFDGNLGVAEKIGFENGAIKCYVRFTKGGRKIYYVNLNKLSLRKADAKHALYVEH